MAQAAPAIERVPFPTNLEEFDADDRISFSKLEEKFILEAEDGKEYEFDHAQKRWVEVVRSEILPARTNKPAMRERNRCRS